MNNPNCNTKHCKGQHLTYKERVEMEIRLKDGWTKYRIAKHFGCSYNTIKNEYDRGKVLRCNGNVEPGAFNSDSGKSLTINGGYVLVDASGDGLDSNGSLLITGGTLIALGNSGMAQSITGDGQSTIMTDITSQSADTMFALCDSNSNVIASFKPAKQFSNVVVSSPSIKTGESYKIVCGGTVDGADENGFTDSGKVT